MQQPLQPSLGADVVRSPHLLIASNATHSVTVYWRDGAAVPFSQLPPKAEGAMRVATMSDTHGKASMFADMLPPKDGLFSFGFCPFSYDFVQSTMC